MPSGTLQYPSIGSVISHQLGPKTDEVPSYVVMGYPNITRDPGFLGAKYGYIYLTQVDIGPNGLVRAPDVDGGLIGGASLKAEDFAKVAEIAQSIAG